LAFHLEQGDFSNSGADKIGAVLPAGQSRGIAGVFWWALAKLEWIGPRRQ